MKKLIRFIALVITLNIICAKFQEQISAQQNNDNYQVFYDHLSPYGQWIENPEYGYVWIPDAEPDFFPYLSNGYWALTDYGWTWVSNYDWGWAAFHYGRWDHNDYYGWFWVPDNEWGPSWVTWRSSGGYYGWAPMRPGVSISITFGNNYELPYDRWIFVRDRDIEKHDIYRNHINRKNNSTYINNSTVINKTYYDDRRRTTYIFGPGRDDVQKITGRTIKPVTVHEKDKPGQIFNNEQLQIYRPQIQKNSSGNKLAPPKITNLKDVKRISERDTEKQPQNKQMPDNKKGKENQPVLNPVNNRENPSPKRNTVSPKNNVIKKQQTVINQENKINNKNNTVQSRKPASPNKESRTVHTPQQQNNVAPKNNAGSEQPQKTRTMNPPKKNSMDQPKSNSNDDKKENRKSK